MDNPKAKPYRSKIHELGLIAIQNIQKDETVGVLGGIIVPTKEINKYWKEMGCVGIQINEDFFIVPSTRKELEETGVFNHSCDPNCGLVNPITFIAIRDIKKGEELTDDYGTTYSVMEEFKCNCGSPKCRKIIKATDWKNPDLQQKSRKYFSPFLKDKI